MSFHNRFHKNVSMTSTNHMSHNSTYFYSTQRPHSKVPNCYAHLPMPKDHAQWNQSATTWRHSPHKYSFSKDSRFKDNHSYYNGILEPEIRGTLCSKSCTLGKGKKKPISEVVLRNAKERPGPDRYDLSQKSEVTHSKSKGRTFGLSWKHYKRTFIKHRKDTYAEFHFENKPAAIYDGTLTNMQSERSQDKTNSSSLHMVDWRCLPRGWQRIRARCLGHTILWMIGICMAWLV